MRKLIVCGVGLVAALVLTVPGAFGGAAQTPGVTAKTITIGGTFPLTGPRGGVCADRARDEDVLQLRQRPQGHRTASAGHGPPDHLEDTTTTATTPRTPSSSRVGSSSRTRCSRRSASSEPSRSSARGAYLNQQKVPQALVSTGASYWGTQYKEFPWTIGWQPDYIAEGRLYGLHIKANHSGKKIAVALPERRLRQGLPLRVPRCARQDSTPTPTSSLRRRSSRPRPAWRRR